MQSPLFRGFLFFTESENAVTEIGFVKFILLRYFWRIMKGISITGDLEKDQQILIFGIGGLIVLIVLAMILLLVLVLVRRNKAAKRAAEAMMRPVEEPTKEEQHKPKEINTPEPVIIPQKVETPFAEVKPETATPVVVQSIPEPVKAPEPELKQEEKAQPVELPKSSPSKEMSLEEKLAEIRQRMAEIKKQNPEGPSIVLPKVGEVSAVKTESPTVEEQQPEEVVEVIENSETPEEPVDEIIQESAPEEVVLDTTVQEKIETPLNTPEIEEKSTVLSPFDKKDLPMKKMTFAEWVEIFKQ